MNAQHTPAPWVHVPRSRDGHVDTITHNGRAFVSVGVPYAESLILNHPHENVQTANARLIAAAPELLEALRGTSKALARVLDKHDPDSNEYEWVGEANEVITKATTP